MEISQEAYAHAREAFANWQEDLNKNAFTRDNDYLHSIHFYFTNNSKQVSSELEVFGEKVPTLLENFVQENNLAINLPRLDQYDKMGNRIDAIIHHPAYSQAGDIIYGSKLLAKMAKPGGLLECLSFLYLSAQCGEAGHNCPIACSAGIIRVLQKVPEFHNKKFYLDKLTAPSFQENYTGAQFLTEIQGGSDVGLNATTATKDEHGEWRIKGEKWFCSNANAELMFITARYAAESKGTKGLSLFLIPRQWNNQKNHFHIRRLKDKIGTRTMATGEIDFHGAYALQIGELNTGFHLVMDNVLHLSRLFNSICVLGMAKRAYIIAHSYAKHRIAFKHPIQNFPLVQENLARIKAETTALLAGVFATIHMQDQFDLKKAEDKPAKLLLRLLVNIMKYLTAKRSVEHIHYALDVLAGEGTIETFSSLPRLLRDCIVCENWEGTHNVLHMQILRDILKYQIDEIFINYMQEQLTNLNNDPEATKLTSKLNDFVQQAKHFKQLTPARQSLQIRKLVDQMGILYCALNLLKEANHQYHSTQSSSKQDCYRYFYQLHLADEEPTLDENYLQLISQLTN